MKGMTILDDMVLEQIVGGRAVEGTVVNSASEKRMPEGAQSAPGIQVAMATGNTPLFIFSPQY